LCARAQGGAGGSSSTGRSSLHELAGQGNVAALQALLQLGGSKRSAAAAPQPTVDARDESGCTPLHFAADRGQAVAAQLLLAAGADVNARDADGQTPLHYAALCERKQVCVAAAHWCW
jgi:ankyrin repeat protein